MTIAKQISPDVNPEAATLLERAYAHSHDHLRFNLDRPRSGWQTGAALHRSGLRTAGRDAGRIDATDVQSVRLLADVVESTYRTLVAGFIAAADVKEKLDSYFMEPIGGTPQDLANFMQTELRVMTPVIKRTGVKID